MLKLSPLILALFISTASAEENTYENLCLDLAGLSNTIMTARQNGVPMTKTMSSLKQVVDQKPMGGVVRQLVIDAYEIHNYRDEARQKQKITEFENKTYLTCLKEFT